MGEFVPKVSHTGPCDRCVSARGEVTQRRHRVRPHHHCAGLASQSRTAQAWALCVYKTRAWARGLYVASVLRVWSLPAEHCGATPLTAPAILT